MPARHNVTTPGGAFIGLGGIFVFCLIAVGMSCWIGNLGPTDDLYEARLAVGLAVPKDTPQKELKAKENAMDAIYQGLGYKDRNVRLTLNELRGVVRKRKAQEVSAASHKLQAEGSVKDAAKDEAILPIDVAIKLTAEELLKKGQGEGFSPQGSKASAVKIDILPPAEPNGDVVLPNLSGNGVKTVNFSLVPKAAPQAAPAPEATPATPQ